MFVTSNPGKAREVESILRFEVPLLRFDAPEIQSLNVEDVVRAKAEAAYAYAGQSVLVEDTGLYLDALNGLPGALVRWFLGTVGAAGIANMIPPGASRAATARSAVALCDGETVAVYSGETRGVIVSQPRGDGGFGWDPIFQPDGSPRTFAEMDQAEKNHYSMRRLALEQLRTRLT